MKLKNKDDFLALSKKVKSDKKTANMVKVLIGYATCGIAAGAKEVEEVLIEHLKTQNLEHVEVVRVGCIGFCHAEPTIEIRHPNGDSVLLGYVKPENASDIIDLHIKDINHESKYVIHRNFDYSLFDGGNK